jgi:hypothetical protein
MPDVDASVYDALKDAILQMDSSIVLHDILKKLNQSFAWEDIQFHYKKHDLPFNKHWKRDLIKRLLPGQFVHGGERNKKSMIASFYQLELTFNYYQYCKNDSRISSML